MSKGLADTSLFIARESGRTLRESLLPDELAVSIVTIGELRAGVLVAQDLATRSRRLRTLTWALSLEPVEVNERVAEEWARLRALLRDAGKRMPVNDSWIAATALSLYLPIVTQDDDYVELRQLPVIRV